MGVSWVGSMAGLFWLSGLSLYMLFSKDVLMFELDLTPLGVLSLSFCVVLDWYSSVFSWVVLLISSCVLMYSEFYMNVNKFFFSFCCLVKMFILCMFLFILVPSVIMMVVGWDGLGLTSFLLVVYYEDKRSLGSGFVTFFSNRIGDGVLAMIVCLSSFSMGWLVVDFLVSPFSWFLGGLILFSSTTKSAQVPFSFWLPCAMAAPTPVSALVHSSTLVTAGAYLLIRFSFCIESWVYQALASLFSISGLVSSISGCNEWDVKKIVAFSTLSQISLIMLAVSIGLINVGFFHLLSHALFKSLLFLSVGSIIFSSGIQDGRHLGGVNRSDCVTFSWLACSCSSLGALPFFTGFYSKDLIFECFMAFGSNSFLVVMMGLTICLTIVYSYYLLGFVFMEPKCLLWSGFSLEHTLHIPCSVLGVMSLVGGIIFQNCVLDFNQFLLCSSFEKFFCLIGLFSFFLLSFYRFSYFNYLGFKYFSWFMGFLTNTVSLVKSCFSFGLFMLDLLVIWVSWRWLSSAGFFLQVVEGGAVEGSLGGVGVWSLGMSFWLKLKGSNFGAISLMLLKFISFCISVFFIFSSSFQ